jgi:hypothetical protein
MGKGWDIREASFLLMGQETLRKRTNKKTAAPANRPPLFVSSAK